MGIDARHCRVHGGSFRTLEYSQNGVLYSILDTGDLRLSSWEKTHGRQFDKMFDHELETFIPDVLLTFGGMPGDMRRMRRARQRHCRIAFCVYNLGYLQNKHFFDDIDAVITPSEFLAGRYREAIGLESTPLPDPIDAADVVSPERDPIFVTMVNPSVEKGLFFFARLAEELGRREPKIAVLAIESRGTAGMVVGAGGAGGFDLRRHESLMIAGAVPSPRDIYTNTRVLLVPSVVEEASGRVVSEALVNGVVPIVSDRGGLAESCRGAGFVLPLPADLTLSTRKPVSAEVVEPWIEAIRRLAFDEPFYQAEVAKVRLAAEQCATERLAAQYGEFFQSLL
jgi:glycosyltransferase involved in cell wall biosynthesis